MRYISIVELDAPESFMLKVGNSPDWQKSFTVKHPVSADVTLVATATSVLITATPIITNHLQSILNYKQTWQRISHGQLVR